MDEYHEHAVLAANRLIEIGRECESVLAVAAEVAESSDLREHYRQRAAIWREFCSALQQAVEDLGGTPPRGPGVSGTLRRAWIKIKSGVGDADAIAAECARREAEALRRCAHAAERDLTPELQALIERFAPELRAAG